jgi:hypothetical protein
MTRDFDRNAESFTVENGPDGQQRLVVHKMLLKAVFFVRDWWGDRYYDDQDDLEERGPISGLPVTVVFRDGEEITGFTGSRERSGDGFFLIPADPHSNNLQIYVIYAAVAQLRFV